MKDVGKREGKIIIDINAAALGILVLFLLLAIADIVYLDVLFIKTKEELLHLKQEMQKKETAAVEISCPSACMSEIEKRAAIIEQSIGNQTSRSTTTIITAANPKESFISFGSGVNATDDWTDVTGLMAYVDTANYQNIQSVTFEASLFIPTGNETAYVRLYNVTDKHAVWNSELSLEGGTAKLLTSPPITLDKGKKLYQVQMKTSLKYEAKVTESRLRILTK